MTVVPRVEPPVGTRGRPFGSLKRISRLGKSHEGRGEPVVKEREETCEDRGGPTWAKCGDLLGKINDVYLKHDPVGKLRDIRGGGIFSVQDRCYRVVGNTGTLFKEQSSKA